MRVYNKSMDYIKENLINDKTLEKVLETANEEIKNGEFEVMSWEELLEDLGSDTTVVD
jgi:hypothetical protein